MDRWKFEMLLTISKTKMMKVTRETSGIGDEISKQTYPKDIDSIRDFVAKFHNYMVGEIDKRLSKVKSREMYKDGWFNIDPYFLANFKAIYSLVKLLFLDKNITTYEVRNSYNGKMINQKMITLCGNSIRKFIFGLNAEGRQYYQRLISNRILQEPTFPSFNSRGISKSIMQDILGKMRKFREHKYKI